MSISSATYNPSIKQETVNTPINKDPLYQYIPPHILKQIRETNQNEQQFRNAQSLEIAFNLIQNTKCRRNNMAYWDGERMVWL